MRRQLSLFVPAAPAVALEALRARLDPVQHALIPAHVTLARDDELEGLAPDDIAARLRNAGPITLKFAAPEAFDGHGVWLPLAEGDEAFQALRRRALGREDVREARAHVTLAHPRNPRAEGNVRDVWAAWPGGFEATFVAVQWIEQIDRAPWIVRHIFPLSAAR